MVTDIGRTAPLIPLLIFESDNYRISVSINERERFEVSRYDHRTQTDTVLLQTQIRSFRKHASKPIGPLIGRLYSRYHIQILDEQSIFANITGCPTQATLKQELFPHSENFQIRVDGPEFPAEGSINSLHIRASSK